MVRILHVLMRDTPMSTIRQLQLLRSHLPNDEYVSEVCSLEANSHRRESIGDCLDDVSFCSLSGDLDLTFLNRFRACMRSVNPDIVHCWGAGSAVVLLANKLFGQQHHIVVSVDDVNSLRANKLWNRWLNSSIHFVVPAEHQRSAMLKLGFSADHVYIVRPGIEFHEGSTVRSMHAEFALPNDAPLVAAIGDLTRKSRFKDAIWALDLLRVLHPESHLVIAGEGDEKALLADYAQSVGVGDGVHFLPNRNDTDQLLAQCFCYWHAGEADSTSILQAMATGLPVISATAPMHQSVLRDGENGIFVPVGDAAAFARNTNLLMQDPALTQRLAERGRSHVQSEFSAESFVDGIEGVYNASVRC